MRKLLKWMGLIKEKKSNRINPCGISHTIIPFEYEKNFPKWDKEMTKNNKNIQKTEYV